MTAIDYLFYFFATLTLFSGLMVVTARQSVHAVLYLILTFISTAALWILIESEFLAIVLVVVYVGAVMVLFLFVVMMLDVHVGSIKTAWRSQWRWGVLGALAASLGTMGLLSYLVRSGAFGLSAYPPPAPRPAGYSDIARLGEVMYTDYILAFIVAGALLLVAIVAAISLTYRGKRGAKSQVAGEQIRIKREQRVRLVDIK